MESIGCLYYNYTFLAPLSDPIFGAHNAPELKRKENNGFGIVVASGQCRRSGALPLLSGTAQCHVHKHLTDAHRAWVVCMRPIGCSLGSLGRLLAGLLEAFSKPLGVRFGASWVLFWASWGPPGASWGPLGGFLGPLGRLLG